MKKLKEYFKHNWVFYVIFVGFLLLDQITKIIFEGKTIPLIQGVFSFTSSHNEGAGFGILSGKTWLLIVITIVFMIFIAYFAYKQKRKNALFRWSIALIFAGAFGNLIDRLIFGYVRDFLFFELINFPIFNVADSCLTIGIILLVVFLLFVEPKLARKEQEQAKEKPEEKSK